MAGCNLSPLRVWRIVRKLGLTYQKPTKRYIEADEKKRKRWIKYELPEIINTAKQYKAVLYFEDESRISLSPVLGKTWSPKGKTPIQKITGKRGSISAISAISKRGKLLFTLHDKNITSDEIIHFLEEMLKHHKRRHIVIIMDNASCHRSKKTKEFIKGNKRLHVFYLPIHSPDFNPDENIWNYLKHHELLSHKAKTKKELLEITNRKLNKISANKKLVKGLFFKCFVAELL